MTTDLKNKSVQDFVFEELNTLFKDVSATSGMPEDLTDRLNQMLGRLNTMAKLGHYAEEFDTLSRYIKVVTSIPWAKKTVDKLDLGLTKQVLDKNHYGMEDVKERILEYMSTMILIQSRGENAVAR